MVQITATCCGLPFLPTGPQHRLLGCPGQCTSFIPHPHKPASPGMILYVSVCVCVCVCARAYVSHSVVSNSLQPHGLQPTRLPCPRNFPGKNTGVPFPTPGDLSDPGIKTGSPALQADSLPSQPPGTPMILYTSHYITLNVPVFV